MDRIAIRELAARCIVGINDDERREKQDVVVSLVLYADLRRAASSDGFEDTVDYRAIKKRVLSLVEGSSFHLLEALAAAVARACLEFRGVERVDVSVEKPGALRFARSVAVEVTRRREGGTMTRAYIGLGSNVEPETNIRAAVRLIAESEHVVAVSTFYRTASIPPGAPEFINGALALDTRKQPLALKFEVLREIEARLGRERGADKNAPRTIDCDLLAFDDEIVHDRDIVLPSPDIEERAFVAIPLYELAPDLVLPGSGHRLADIRASVPQEAMSPLAELTAELRRELKEVHHGSSPRRSTRAAAPR